MWKIKKVLKGKAGIAFALRDGFHTHSVVVRHRCSNTGIQGDWNIFYRCSVHSINSTSGQLSHLVKSTWISSKVWMRTIKRSICVVKCDWLSRIILLFFFPNYCLFSLCSLFMELLGDIPTKENLEEAFAKYFPHDYPLSKLLYNYFHLQ